MLITGDGALRTSIDKSKSRTRERKQKSQNRNTEPKVIEHHENEDSVNRLKSAAVSTSRKTPRECSRLRKSSKKPLLDNKLTP